MKHAEIFTRLAQRSDPNIPILDAAMDEIASLQAKIAALEAENKAIRTLMNTYNLGGWTDSLGCISDLQTTIAQQTEEIARLKTVPMKYRRMAFNAELQEENKQQAERIKKLEQRINENAMPDDYIQMADEITDLKAKLAAAEKDAERYRWLRSNHPIHDNSP